MTLSELIEKLQAFDGCDSCAVRVDGKHIDDVCFKSITGVWPDEHDNLKEQTISYLSLNT